MASSFEKSHATAVSLDDIPDTVRLATCPMCHTPATLSQDAVETGGDWRCVRCGQHWGAARLAAVAAYAAWTVDHGREGRRGTSGSQAAAPIVYSPTTPQGGRP